MKNVCKKIFMLVCFFSLSRNAYAICSNEDLVKYNSEAANAKVTYEIITEEYKGEEEESDIGNSYTSYVDNFKVSANNLSDNLYIVVKNDRDNKTLTFSNSSNVTSANFYDHSSVINLTYEVYTNSNTLCPNEKLLTNYLKLPMYNNFYSYDICYSHRDVEECGKYVFNPVSISDFDKFLKKEEDKAISKRNEEKDNKKSNKKYFIIGGIVVGIIIILSVIIFIARRRGRII